MQARRQDCRISSKPLVIFVPKYGFVQIREGPWGGRLPFPDLRAHDPLCACRRSLCFSVEVPFDVKFWQGRPQPLVDVATHGAEPDVRHVQDRVFHLAPHSSIALRSGQPGGRQPRGGICESFPGACRTLASGLRWRFRVFLPPAVQGGSVGTHIVYAAYFGPFSPF